MKRFSSVRDHAEVPSDEPRWHASLAVLLAIALYVTLPPRLTLGPVWAGPIIVLVILVALNIVAPKRHNESVWVRTLAIITIAIMNIWNISSVLLLVWDVLGHQVHNHAVTGFDLLLGGGEIWLTNVIVFALWFWELDGGGPEPRAHATAATEFCEADFLFPQMQLDKQRLACAEKPWKPHFVDYLYLSFTNALAFSPTDTMPLSAMAKMLMLAESLVSFVTIAIVVSRSINIIGG